MARWPPFGESQCKAWFARLARPGQFPLLAPELKAVCQAWMSWKLFWRNMDDFPSGPSRGNLIRNEKPNQCVLYFLQGIAQIPVQREVEKEKLR